MIHGKNKKIGFAAEDGSRDEQVGEERKILSSIKERIFEFKEKI